MKAQLTIEFLTITLVLIAYLSVVFSLFSSAKSALTNAVDDKLEHRLQTWIEFINQRPIGTSIKINFTPFPKRTLEIICGQTTSILNRNLPIFSQCSQFNITTKTCLEIEKINNGVNIEIC